MALKFHRWLRCFWFLIFELCYVDTNRKNANMNRAWPEGRALIAGQLSYIIHNAILLQLNILHEAGL